MNKGKLTPRSADVVEEMRFSGGFGQPDGFASVLTATVRMDGSLCLRLEFRGVNDQENFWAVELTSDQREVLAQMANRYRPRLYEKTERDRAAPETMGTPMKCTRNTAPRARYHYRGVTRTIPAWAAYWGISYHAAYWRLTRGKKGWDSGRPAIGATP